MPGSATSQRKTRQDAVANTRDAISGYLASLKKHSEPTPSVDEETVEIRVWCVGLRCLLEGVDLC